MMTWKIVRVSKVSVMYIYIYIYRLYVKFLHMLDDQEHSGFNFFFFFLLFKITKHNER